MSRGETVRQWRDCDICQNRRWDDWKGWRDLDGLGDACTRCAYALDRLVDEVVADGRLRVSANRLVEAVIISRVKTGTGDER